MLTQEYILFHCMELVTCASLVSCYYSFSFIEDLPQSIFSEYCEKYAKPTDAGVAPDEKSSDEELTEDEYASSDEEVAGKADP